MPWSDPENRNGLQATKDDLQAFEVEYYSAGGCVDWSQVDEILALTPDGPHVALGWSEPTKPMRIRNIIIEKVTMNHFMTVARPSATFNELDKVLGTWRTGSNEAKFAQRSAITRWVLPIFISGVHSAHNPKGNI